ncbi:substrate-binding domain-containing protein [Arthrobacter sp. AK01]|uniref:substrate-binding domain-containing protein n=1 Tax=Micrococcaceae TaxID=1268 RepID=UPI001E3E1D4E|nr:MULTISPECIES: substrate-binding domain-containing protein [Micrococcaceae]MCD4851794.1 substrate-binding domain-containing protein [Arthrobacter sp. AK01]MCP1411331.1 DNA-binding LacI/PurR family transcriptional regulator [Paenarthrobacter sp. A20]
MLSEDRQQLILRELALHGSLNAGEFAAKLGTSGMTVRRDLAVLAEQGLLERVHGGAVSTGGKPAGPAAPQSTSWRPGGRRPLATIGMIVPSASYYFPGVIRGAEAAAQEAGVRLVLGVSNYSAAEERRQLRRLYDHGVDGILITPSEQSLAKTETLDLLAESEVPVVVVERSIDDALDFGRLESVRSDHVRGSEIAVNHLLGLGHQRIAICLRENSPTASQLIDGFHIAMQRAGHPHDDSMVRAMSRAQNDPQAHRELMNGILDWCASTGVTAAVVHTDEDALQFVSACLERQVRVPEDFAIVSYDDEIAALGAVPLTAVAPPKYDVGHQALVMCLTRIGGRRGSTSALQRVNLSPALVVRDSTQA